MNDTLLQIDMAADQVEMGAVQVSNASQILAQGAAEQAASVEELSAAASGFTRQITSNAEYSQQMNGFGKQSGEMVKKARWRWNRWSMQSRILRRHLRVSVIS